MIEIRAMKKSEAEEVKKLGKKTFEWFEGLFIPEPKNCFVAVEENNIIGAVLYKFFTVADKKIGYVDYIFVDENVHDKGIGSKLVDRCLKAMEKEDCDGCSALVRDDNVGSWKMFINRGLQRVGLDDLVRNFGILDMLKLTFKTPFIFATGMDYYLKLGADDLSTRKGNSLFQAFKYLILTALLLSPGFIHGIENALSIIAAIAAIIVIRIAFGYLGTLFSKENWHFRVCDGGYIIPFIASFFNGIFLISGNWYPEVYRKESDFKRSLGFTALAQWISLITIILITKTQLGQTQFLGIMGEMSVFIMMISIVPLYPLASFGGKRIFEWNKWIYIIVLLISFYILFLY
ncbi:ribosomal protein S18 acetylase RimI-like enzyme [Halanaerobium saccharolyticum]|uniref:Ribosomal protein S18 acetylase RimI-like enzyme n=2 Tax=Halanaerobium saccharolyticum TaxID=43595 RepID=A0A2T5RJ06_9FIRM|nr:ribosomal protein S18 acetylase RimI-like enzyme [Halanaerobium saccharolyticum]